MLQKPQMLPESDRVLDEGGVTAGRRLRVAFLTPMPSPYIQDLFEAMHLDGRIEIGVFYMEMSAHDTHWGDASMPTYARVLPGKGYLALGIRFHINPGACRVISAWRPDVVVVGGYSSITCQQ